MIDTISTHAAQPPRAFHELRRALQCAAGQGVPENVASQRTRAAIAELRERADAFHESMECWPGQPLGDWYGILATRFHEAAAELETDAKQAGVLS